MNWGSLVDCLWTTPELFNAEYVVTPKDAPQRPTEAMLNAAKPSQSSIDRQRWWAEFSQRCEGKTVISAQMEEEARSAVSMLDQHPTANEVHHASKKQVAIVGENPVASGKAKCLIDLLPMASGWGADWSKYIVDLKTSSDVSDYGMTSSIIKYDYVAKLAWYCMMAEAAGYGPRPQGILIWQNSLYPYDVHVRTLEEAVIDIGRRAVMKRIARMQEISRSRLVELMDVKIKPQVLPAWAEAAIMGE